MAAPAIEAGDVTVTSVGAVANGVAWNYDTPAYNSGDLIIICVAVDDDDTSGGYHTWGSGQNSETITNINVNYGGRSGSAAGPTVQAGYYVATSTETAGTGTFSVTNVGGTEASIGYVIKVPSGEFNATTPIQAVSALFDDSFGGLTTVTSPALTADEVGRLVWFVGEESAAGDLTPATGWTTIASQQGGDVTGFVVVRDAETTASESVSSVNHSQTGEIPYATILFLVNEPAAASSGGALPLINGGLIG